MSSLTQRASIKTQDESLIDNVPALEGSLEMVLELPDFLVNPVAHERLAGAVGTHRG